MSYETLHYAVDGPIVGTFTIQPTADANTYASQTFPMQIPAAGTYYLSSTVPLDASLSEYVIGLVGPDPLEQRDDLILCGVVNSHGDARTAVRSDHVCGFFNCLGPTGVDVARYVRLHFPRSPRSVPARPMRPAIRTIGNGFSSRSCGPSLEICGACVAGGGALTTIVCVAIVQPRHARPAATTKAT